VSGEPSSSDAPTGAAGDAPKRWSDWPRLLGRVLIAFVVLWCVLDFGQHWLLFGPGAMRVRAVCKAVVDSGVLPPNADAKCRPGVWEADLLVYGVLDSATQDRVVEVVRAARERKHAKSIRIEFRSAFTMRPTGPDWSVADPGELLRTELAR
jgi:hypothetical protein